MNCNPANLARIKKSLLWVSAKPDGIVVNHSDGVENLLVIKEGSLVSLHFMDTKILLAKTVVSDMMSNIDISRPLNLLGKYAQAMMLTVVFKPQPKRLYMLGFGGGRVPMVFHHYFSSLQVEASEHSQGVVQLAEVCFGISNDDRMKISVADGREHLETFPESHFDIILLDSFSGVGEHPNQLSTQEFYQLCKSRLTHDGVVATNLVDNNPYFKQKVATFCAAFKYSYQYENAGSLIFFGSDADDFSQADFKQKAAKIHAQYDFEFPFVESSERITACQAEVFSNKRLRDDDVYS
ncbi:MAG TPA: hypothetical protein EYG68_01140 [Leucothrix mucor]|nr:hypothetical protein [Leucothrix mucor]